MLPEGKKEPTNDQGQLSIFKDELEFTRSRKRNTILEDMKMGNMEGGEVEKLVRWARANP